jgi:Uma2 family endonuclease
MSAAQVDEPVLLTWDEYVKFETVYEGRRHELVRGRVHLMAGGSERHDILVQLINVRLYLAFDGGPCVVFTHNRKIRTGESTGFYPDIMVRCGDAAHPLYETDARFVIEVLSPSNDAADLTERLFGYQGLPSVEIIVFADPARRLLIVHERIDARWTERQITSGELWLGPGSLKVPELWDEADARVTSG